MSIGFTNPNLNSNYILKHIDNEWCSPEDYGAVGDGITDDTNAFQIALNIGKSVKCYKKEYKVFGVLQVPSNILIDLNGATININGQTLFNISGKENVVIKNGKITGYTNSSIFAVLIDNSTYCHLDNITCEEVMAGFYFGGANTSYITTSNLKVINSRYQAYTHIGGANRIHHTNPSTYNAVWGMNAGNCEYVEVVNGIFELGSATTTPTGSYDYFITNSHSTGPEHGIYFQNSNHIKVVNCIFKGWKFLAPNPKSAGIKFRNGEDFQVIGGLVDDCNLLLSLPAENAPAPSNLYLYQKDILIDGVVFTNCIRTGGSILIWNKAGIEPMNVNITNCVFKDTNASLAIACWDGNANSNIRVSNCQFQKGLSISDEGGSNVYNGSIIIHNCYFTPTSLFSLKIYDIAGKKIVLNNIFTNCNTSALIATTDQQNADIAFISLGNEGDEIQIVGNQFLEENRRRVGINSTSGTFQNLLLANNVGGGDVFFAGTAGDNYMSNNTNYSNTVPAGIITAQNNKDLNNPTANY